MIMLTNAIETVFNSQFNFVRPLNITITKTNSCSLFYFDLY